MVTSKKHSSAKDKKVSNGGEQGEESLVGSRVRVWWPIDRKFYKGVVDSYDSSKKKHKVLYDDGDKENLDMEKERWELIEEDNDKADVFSLQDDSATESSDAELETLNKKKATPLSKGKTDEATPKKKQKIDSSAKSKSKAKSGKKSEGSEGAREKSKSGVKKAEKLKNEEEKHTPKAETEKKGKLGDIGGKIVAAASRMSGRFQVKENGQGQEAPKSLKPCKNNSESSKLKQKRPSSSPEAVSEKMKKPRTSSKKIKSNNIDHEDVVDDTSDDESKPLISFLKKSPEAVEALMEKLRKKKEKEAAGEGSSGNKAKEEAEAEVEAEEEAEVEAEVEAEEGAKEES